MSQLIIFKNNKLLNLIIINHTEVKDDEKAKKIFSDLFLNISKRIVYLKVM
jgi:hypothetical protein